MNQSTFIFVIKLHQLCFEIISLIKCWHQVMVEFIIQNLCQKYGMIYCRSHRQTFFVGEL